ncbi:FMN-binding protein [Mesorhizobium argentiipisi]|uniref:FMN-binding protein n=1 Tax=Mesorhizobium argentiipisi TaxID=3015175 RepID=A0ABU8KAI5_9HYPH
MKQIALSLIVIASSGACIWAQTEHGPANDLIDGALSAKANGDALPPVVSLAAAYPVAAPAAALPIVRQEDVRPAPTLRMPREIGKETTGGIAAHAPKPALAAGQPQVSQMPPAPPEQKFAPAPASPTLPEMPSFAVTPAVYIPIPQPRPGYPQAPAHAFRTGMKLAAHGYADGVYTGPAADAYYGIIQLQVLVQNGRLTALKVLKYPSDRRTSVSINRQALPMLREEAIRAQSADVDIISGATLTSRAFIQSLGGALEKASS